jgi:hypothetical protein
MSIIMEKEEAHKMIDRMSDGATWDDLIQEIYVRETIEKGLRAAEAGNVKSVQDIRAKYGLSK